MLSHSAPLKALVLGRQTTRLIGEETETDLTEQARMSGRLGEDRREEEEGAVSDGGDRSNDRGRLEDEKLSCFVGHRCRNQGEDDIAEGEKPGMSHQKALRYL